MLLIETWLFILFYNSSVWFLGRPPKQYSKRSSLQHKNDQTNTSKPDIDDPSLRRSSRKRRTSTYQENEQQSKRRKEDERPSEEIDNEAESEIDEAGEKKIDKHGNLQDGKWK